MKKRKKEEYKCYCLRKKDKKKENINERRIRNKKNKKERKYKCYCLCYVKDINVISKI